MQTRPGISGRWLFPQRGLWSRPGTRGSRRILATKRRQGRAGVGVLAGLAGPGRPATTQRSYALALLRWFRFTWAIDVPWDQATRGEARDFCRWLQLADKPGRARRGSGMVPGKRPSPARFAPATVAHCETVCRELLRLSPGGRDRADREPVPAGQARAGARAPQSDGPVPEAEAGPVPSPGPPAGAAADPRQRVQRAVRGLGRTGTGRWSRSGSPPALAHRNCWASPSGADPGEQLVTVIRKGSRAIQRSRRRRTRSSGCGSTSRRFTGWCPPGQTIPCGGRCGARSGRCPTTRPARCSTGPTPPSDRVDPAFPSPHGGLPAGT